MLNLESLSPAITTMIRLDHSHALAAFRRYRSDLSLRRKRAIVQNVCLALSIHAQLEEEIFYPALAAAGDESPALTKSVPEHDEMRKVIALLSSMEPTDPAFDETFRTLMRTVLHHVADEETILLPQAEALIGNQLSLLGARMTRRRIQLLAPHLPQVAQSTAQTFPVATVAAIVTASTCRR